MESRYINRYQGAIMRGEEILLIQHHEHNGRTYWLLPGGGIEPGESELDCVRREMREETGLEVDVERLLLDDPAEDYQGGPYQRYKTYLCRPLQGEAAPGYEPEASAAAVYAITAVAWVNLYDEASWDELILTDIITAPALRRVRVALGG